MNDTIPTRAEMFAALHDPELDAIRAAQPDQIEFCPACARTAQVYLPGRWSIGPVYSCPTCKLRFTLTYDTAASDDPTVLRSKLVRVA